MKVDVFLKDFEELLSDNKLGFLIKKITQEEKLNTEDKTKIIEIKEYLIEKQTAYNVNEYYEYYKNAKTAGHKVVVVQGFAEKGSKTQRIKSRKSNKLSKSKSLGRKKSESLGRKSSVKQYGGDNLVNLIRLIHVFFLFYIFLMTGGVAIINRILSVSANRLGSGISFFINIFKLFGALIRSRINLFTYHEPVATMAYSEHHPLFVKAAPIDLSEEQSRVVVHDYEVFNVNDGRQHLMDVIRDCRIYLQNFQELENEHIRNLEILNRPRTKLERITGRPRRSRREQEQRNLGDARENVIYWQYQLEHAQLQLTDAEVAAENQRQCEQGFLVQEVQAYENAIIVSEEPDIITFINLNKVFNDLLNCFSRRR